MDFFRIFSSVFANGRYGNTDFLEPISGADTAFAPSIYITKITLPLPNIY